MGEERDYSDEIAVQIDQEVARIIKEAEAKATHILTKYRKALDKLTEQLLEKETVGGDELTKMLQDDTGISKPETTIV